MKLRFSLFHQAPEKKEEKKVHKLSEQIRLRIVMKASLLPGVGFALAIIGGRLDAAPMIFHVELVLPPPPCVGHD